MICPLRPALGSAQECACAAAAKWVAGERERATKRETEREYWLERERRQKNGASRRSKSRR